jgi:hypothetical protein
LTGIWSDPFNGGSPEVLEYSNKNPIEI